MVVYLASNILNKCMVEFIATKIEECGHIVSSTWHSEIGEELSLQDRALIDFRDLDEADVCVVLYPYGETGTLQEMAYAIGRNKIVIYVRHPDFEDDDPLIVGLFGEKVSVLKTEYKGLIVPDINSCLLMLECLDNKV